MERIKGLEDYVRGRFYKDALKIPQHEEVEYSLLAQGEYNMNYMFIHPVTGKKLLLRVNCGSQMHLENQIQYEYHALQILAKSGRTPLPFYVDGSLSKLDHGVMVMEYLPGEALDYGKDLHLAAECLADIHSVEVTEDMGLIKPQNPLKAILEECEEMVKTYMDSPLGSLQTKRQIRRLLDKGWEAMSKLLVEDGYRCCINTELNSTNFLINGDGEQNYLIDWEKPLYGDPAQDLGHFLAPTTTFWKTDIILEPEEIEQFITNYITAVSGRYETSNLRNRVHAYIPITCLRGITWCAMAWVQYQQPDKVIVNESTAKKLEAYLSAEFLLKIEADQFM